VSLDRMLRTTYRSLGPVCACAPAAVASPTKHAAAVQTLSLRMPSPPIRMPSSGDTRGEA
jgi:hypothetical protein